MSSFFSEKIVPNSKKEDPEEDFGLPLSASFIRTDDSDYYEKLRAKYIDMQRAVDDLKDRGILDKANPDELRQFEEIRREFSEHQAERFPRLESEDSEDSENAKKGRCIIL